MVPNARFLEFLADIEPSSTTTSNASAAHTGVRDHLQAHEDFSTHWKDDFLAGSYARETSIRPRSNSDGIERPDVDIMVVTNYTTSDSPEDVLNDIAEALGDEYDVERINKRSVRLVTSQAEMDVVPLIEAGSAYQIPDRDLGRWKTTNPRAHTTWSSDQNKLFGGRFKRLVKLLKWWRRENPTGKRPKGFVLEVLMSLHAPRTESHFGECLAKSLENIHAAYKAYVALNLKPTIADPSTGTDMLDKVSLAQWNDFIEKVRVYAGIARRAQDEDDMEEATRQWRRVFSDRFPNTPSTDARSMVTRVAASAPAAGYAFPNANATPTKPRGFA